jgi:GT2 family glycosyltransferase/tetratricopeptide (TPR) repeat protein/2-polyprenyl-3-methyl-5-hydroxy-6-metoxy-1,4-benzoquinol methylase
VEVEHVLPTEIHRCQAGQFDLYLYIDDGLDYPFPADLRPAAYWAIDTHLDFERARLRGGWVDLLFAAQKDGADRLRMAGINSATWLPLACDPALHHPHEVPKEFDVCFVGNLFPGSRAELLELLQRNFSNTFVGQRYFDEMARIYSASRIVLNRSLKNDVNMRVFEGLACGSLLVTNDLSENGQAELVRDGTHLATYRDDEELLDKLRYYLNHEPLREEIAANGRAEVVSHHTYVHRMRAILEKVARFGFPATVSVPSIPTPESEARPAKESSYFEFSRPEILELVPLSAQHVLDVGCGSGRLGDSIKARQSAEVVGIELNRHAAEIARQRLDEVVIGNIEAGQMEFPGGRFDCLICADVLEHLREPSSVLEEFHRWLTPEGTLIASVPNVRNHTVIQALLEGNWTYESAGLLDQDHVRFFTRREIEKLLYRSGFEIESLSFVPGEGYREWEQQGRPTAVDVGGLRIPHRSQEDAAELFAYQYLIVARPCGRNSTLHQNSHPVTVESGHERIASGSMTSIIIVTYNELAYTRLCIDSLRLRTDEPYELIFVDNGSTDGTVDYLNSLEEVTVIANPDNRGFPAAANQGIRAAKGNQILLLNNDTVLTTGWLRRMLDLLDRQPEVGLVGPCSNSCSGPQEIQFSYRRLESLDGFGWEWGKAHHRHVMEVDRLVGFCFLFRRSVIDQIGLLDERFGIGNFEDDDFCRRAIAAGFKAAIAADSFIHHFGSRTFVGSGVDFRGLLEENRRKYEAKWNSPAKPAVAAPPAASPKTPMESRTAPHPFMVKCEPKGGLLLTANTIRLSLCMIVRDNESTIRQCLESIKPFVDEIIVVDTGSRDRTREVCRDFGARLCEFPWCDDFSAARNESLKYARGEWIFWMDSDDTIPADCGQKLRTLVDGSHQANALGYVMQVHCPGPSRDGISETTVVDHVKLIRNRPDLRFEGRIHEQLLPSIRRAGGDVAWTDLYVVHSGSNHSPESWERKLERDLRILHQEQTEKPDHPFVLFNLGMTFADAKRYDEAIGSLEKCLAVSQPEESHLRKAYALLVNTLTQADRHDNAWRTCQEGLELYPADKELLFRSAMLHHHFGRLRQAVSAYLQVLNESVERYFTSIDQGLTSYKARHNLAIVYDEMGCLDSAEEEWHRITRERPDYAAGWRGLGDVLLRRGKLTAASQEAQQLLASDGILKREGILLRGRIAAAEGNFATAIADFEEADRMDPADLEALQSLCRLQFEQDALSNAERALRELTSRAPTDAAAFHNLGFIQFRLQDFEAAERSLRRSLALRPESIDTHVQLGRVLVETQRSEDARLVWQEVLRRAPHHPEATSRLQQQQQFELQTAPR